MRQTISIIVGVVAFLLLLAGCWLSLGGFNTAAQTTLTPSGLAITFEGFERQENKMMARVRVENQTAASLWYYGTPISDTPIYKVQRWRGLAWREPTIYWWELMGTLNYELMAGGTKSVLIALDGNEEMIRPGFMIRKGDESTAVVWSDPIHIPYSSRAQIQYQAWLIERRFQAQQIKQRLGQLVSP